DVDGGVLDPLRVFTTRPDTVMGVTFVSIAAEHAAGTWTAACWIRCACSPPVRIP
ncbi:hypothetical protein C7E25_25410, partial [Stenotrophomonas maltophilia]